MAKGQGLLSTGGLLFIDVLTLRNPLKTLGLRDYIVKGASKYNSAGHGPKVS
jgi:hypothetical protein